MFWTAHNISRALWMGSKVQALRGYNQRAMATRVRLEPARRKHESELECG
eukprot:JP438165.1.p2 GENE.JP438165.1~~JP438165.1.p2  ORF type:complete len:50 (-),score=0.94 JP438165.1:148-297(-)